MAKFAILMLETPGAWSRLPKAEQGRLLALYGAWVGELRRSGAFVDGWPFGGDARVLRGATGGVEVSEAPADRPAETGMFLVEAPDLDAAVALARGCPALVHGETVVVRPVGHV